MNKVKQFLKRWLEEEVVTEFLPKVLDEGDDVIRVLETDDEVYEVKVVFKKIKRG